MYNHVINNLFRLAEPCIAAVFICLPISTLTYAADKQQIQYKWTDAIGMTQYTQTPPDQDIPFEEVDNLQAEQQLEPLSTSTATESGSTSASMQTNSPARTDNDRFSPVPQNARIIPNSYGYSSSEYKVSPTKAALDKSRND